MIQFGEMIQFDEHIFQRGWFNHQLVNFGGGGGKTAICLTVGKLGSFTTDERTNHRHLPKAEEIWLAMDSSKTGMT